MSALRRTAALALALCACASAALAADAVLTGIDVLEQNNFAELKDKRIGLITNQTGMDRNGRSTAQILANAPGVSLTAIFSPEHGFTGTSEADKIESGRYPLPSGGDIPLHSLYGATKAPTSDMLKGLDALVFDMQDIGARFYTYSTTMAMALEAAAKEDIEFIVLDRPNPIKGDIIEGALLDPDIRQFIAYFPVPVRHGMTMGELARLHNSSVRLGARLRVVALKGWRRELWYDQTGLPWTKPSPNMPDLESATLYPGIACFENANVSVGRGTPLPFRWIGAPWMDSKKVVKRMKKAGLEGISFETKSFTPGKSVFSGEQSPGVRMLITDRDKLRPLRVFAHLVTALRDIHPKEFKVVNERMAAMTGTLRFNDLYLSGAGAEKIIELFDGDAGRFMAERAAFLLY